MSCDEGFVGVSVPSMEQQLVDGSLCEFTGDLCSRD